MKALTIIILSLLMVAIGLSLVLGAWLWLIIAILLTMLFLTTGLIQTSSPQTIYFLGRIAVGTTSGGGTIDFIPLMHILFFTKEKKTTVKGIRTIITVIAMILVLVVLFFAVLPASSLGRAFISGILSVFNAESPFQTETTDDRLPTGRLERGGYYAFVLAPDETTQWLSADAMWHMTATGRVQLSFPLVSKKYNYDPGDNVYYGPYNTFSLTNITKENVWVEIRIDP
jgi:hypothetical protein